MNSAAVNNSAGSLCVDNLQPDVTEAMLFEKFCKVGTILTIRVCRDAVTRRSLGYGYVNFQHVADAERAVDTLDLDALKGRPMQVSFKDPALRRSGQSKVFIKNLDKTIDNKAIYEGFSAFGNILACKVATDENGENCGYGFVRFKTEEAAQSAVQKATIQLNDHSVTIEKYVPRRERATGSGGDQATNFTNVFIKNFAVEWSEEDLYRICQPHGKISSLRIMMDTVGNSKGFGFVSFESHEAAEQCVDALNGREFNGRQVFAGRAQTKSERSAAVPTRPESSGRPQGVNLYIKNLDDDVDDEKLRKEFSRFGTITSVKVMRHESGISRGFGFVCYTSQEAASQAVQQMNNHVISNKPLYVALHQSKEVRQAQLATQRMNIGYHVPGQPMTQVFPAPRFTGAFYQNQGTLSTQGGVPPQASMPTQVSTIQGGSVPPQTVTAHPSHGGYQPHSHPTQTSLHSHPSHHPRATTLQAGYPNQRGLLHHHGTHHHLAQQQGGMYQVQFAPQVHHPRWPTAAAQVHPSATHHTGGYQVLGGHPVAHQYGAVNHMVPRNMGPPHGHITDESQIGQMR